MTMTYGADRLKTDLEKLGYEKLYLLKDSDDKSYVIIPDYVINLGRFKDIVIKLGIPAPDDYPRSVGPPECLHSRS